MAYFLKLHEVIAQTTDNAEKPGCAEESLVHFVLVEVSKNNLKQMGPFSVYSLFELDIVSNYYLIDKRNSYRSYPKHCRSKKRKKL